MTEIPRRPAQRSARLASLPLGMAGRKAASWGKRLGGVSRDDANAEFSAKTAEQLFAVLGELKGGAMKFGQALSVFEAAVPEELAAPYRDALIKLQSAAPPMPPKTVHRVLDEQLGTAWRKRFGDFDDVPAAAASIGQVHRATWHNGRDVAVKVQYPGADEALMSDLRQLQRFSRLFQLMAPGVDIKPLLAELRERMAEELDYRGEAEYQRTFAKAYAHDPDIYIPSVVASSPKVLVSEWVTGTPLSAIIGSGTQEERNDIGYKLVLLAYSAPTRARLLHADPHPGNFMRLSDGRLCAIDFGAAARLPDGLPETLGRATRLAMEGRSGDLMELMSKEGFVRPGMSLEPEEIYSYLAPFAEPVREETFHFTRSWMQQQAERVGGWGSKDFETGRALNLPPSYLLIHRVLGGGTGILCQLGAEIPLRKIFEEWQPGFASAG